MPDYTIQALDTEGTVVASTTVTATGTTDLGTVASLFPSLSGDHTFRAITPETLVYTAGTDPLVSMFGAGENGVIYKASNVTGNVGTNASAIPDLSPNGHNAVQATAANQPLIGEAGGVRFLTTNGTSHWMRIPGMALDTSDVTMLFAVRNTDQTMNIGANSALRPLLYAADEDPAQTLNSYHSVGFVRASIGDNFDWVLWTGSAVERADAVRSPTPNNLFSVFAVRKTGTTAELYQDGVLLATGTLSTTSGFGLGEYALFASPSAIDAGRAYEGDFTGAMIITRSLSNAELSTATTEIGNTADLTV